MQRLTTIRILWAAMLTNVVVFAGLAAFVIEVPPDSAPPPMLPHILAAAALGSVVASALLPGILFRKALGTMSPAIEEVADAHAETMFRDMAPRVRVFADPDGAREAALTHFYTPCILRLALLESIAIYGLVVHFLGAALLVSGAFFAASFLTIALAFPRSEPVESALEATCAARLPPRR